jgi:hypothetical protein
LPTIVPAGQATLDKVTVNGNTADIEGGGILNAGNLTVTNSTISRNTVGFPLISKPVILAGDGGGITNLGTAHITNSTISGNDAPRGGGYSEGFQPIFLIVVTSSGTLSPGANGTLQFVTIRNNSATETDGGGGILVYRDPYIDAAAAKKPQPAAKGVISGNALTVHDTIVSGEVREGSDCSYTDPLFPNTLGSLTTSYNIETQTACKFTGTGDRQNTSPAPIGPLAFNGGPTKTHALIKGSPALNKAVPGCAAVKHDQRGVKRPQPPGGRCDIGAFELVQKKPGNPEEPGGGTTTLPTPVVPPLILPNTSAYSPVDAVGLAALAIVTGLAAVGMVFLAIRRTAD